MSLRVRIALFVGIATLLLSLVFVAQVVLSLRVADRAARHDTALLIEAMWHSYINDEGAAQDVVADQIRRNVEILNALSQQQPDAVADIMAKTTIKRDDEIVVIVDKARRAVYDNQAGALPADFTIHAATLVRPTDTDGFTTFDFGNGMMTYRVKVVPLRFRFGVVGYVIVAAPVSRLVSRFDKSVDLDAALIPFEDAGDAVLSHDAAANDAVLIALNDDFKDGRIISYLGVSNEQWSEWRQTQWLQWLAGGLVIVFVGHVLGGLVRMVKRAFAPLDSTINVIDKLTQGEEAPPLDTSGGTLEIQRLSNAVESLRSAHSDRESLRKLQTELSIASELQQSLLPREPLALEGISLHGRMAPSQEVAGDYFDYFIIDDERVGFLVADVCGKGTPAALFMAMSRAVVRSLAMTGRPPGEVLREANQVLAETNDKNMFVTLFYAVIDRASGMLSYANAGHSEPILKTREGKVSYLKTTGDLVLGMIADIDFATVEMTIPPGSLLVTFTDGIPEAFDINDEQFGEERLLDLVRDTAITDPAALIEALHGEVLRFAKGRPQYDDITLCIGAF